jgi:hypothetical protein
VAVGEVGAAALVDGGRGKRRRRRRESYLGRAGKFGGEADQQRVNPRVSAVRGLFAVRLATTDTLPTLCRV